MPTLSILVFVATPLDYARYRHTALFLDFAPNNRENLNETAAHDFVSPAKNDTDESASKGKSERNPDTILSDSNFEPELKDAATDTEIDVTKETTDSSDIRSSLMEITGAPGFFSFAERVNIDSDGPISSLPNLARIIPVSSIANAPPPALRLITADTPIPTDIPEESDWNSQNWVGDALGRLVLAGYLDPGDRDRALDEMIDVVLEAGDEEITPASG